MAELLADPLFSGGPLPAWVVTLNGAILGANRAASDTLGYSDDEFKALTFEQLAEPSGAALPKLDAAQAAPRLWLRSKSRGLVHVALLRQSLLAGAERLSLVSAFVLGADACESTSAQSPASPGTLDPNGTQEPPGEMKFRAVFDGAPMGMALGTLADGKFVDVNQVLLDMLGRSRDEVMGRTTNELSIWLEPMDRSALIREVLSGKPVRLHQTRILGAGGQARDVMLSIAIVNLDGIPHLLATYQDITSQVREQAALALREARLARALQGSAEGEWEWQIRTGELYYSERWATLLGYEVSALPNTADTPFGLCHPDDKERVNQALQAHFQTRERLDINLRLLTAHGTYRWVKSRAQATWDASGQPFRLSGTIDDIHDDHLAALGRQRTEQRLALATSAARIGTWEMFPDGSAVWDAEAYRSYGYSPTTPLLPEQIYRCSLSHGEFLRTRKWLLSTLASGEGGSIEFELCWPNGETRWMVAKGKALLDANGTPTSLLGVNWDISEQRRAHEALLGHQRQLSELAHELLEQERRTTSRIALTLHDHLGQTLTALRLSFDASLGAAADMAGDRNVQRMDALLEQATSLIHDVLQDLRPPFLEDLGLAAALDNEIANPTLQRSSVDLMLLLDDQVGQLRWPSDVEYACFMIAREAVANALEHSMASLIQVTLNASGSGLMLEITDDGIGFQTKGLMGRSGNLGLVGMRERAQAIGARLDVDSTPGEGVRVSLRWEPKP
ncbi:PAS domain-containing protein [Roseateles sp.]|uniref:PAS domain-containing protein n=1 Tax=Roseateles sp. TaxID=1971397 RepID=UPI0037C6DBDF